MLTPEDINNTSRAFYSKLYTSNHEPDALDIDFFLNNLNLPKLTQEHTYLYDLELMDRPLTKDEYIKALSQLPNNKAPVPDGFPAKFFKHFWSTVSSLFIRMCQDTKQNSTKHEHEPLIATEARQRSTSVAPATAPSLIKQTLK